MSFQSRVCITVEMNKLLWDDEFIRKQRLSCLCWDRGIKILDSNRIFASVYSIDLRLSLTNVAKFILNIFRITGEKISTLTSSHRVAVYENRTRINQDVRLMKWNLFGKRFTRSLRRFLLYNLKKNAFSNLHHVGYVCKNNSLFSKTDKTLYFVQTIYKEKKKLSDSFYQSSPF